MAVLRSCPPCAARRPAILPELHFVSPACWGLVAPAFRSLSLKPPRGWRAPPHQMASGVQFRKSFRGWRVVRVEPKSTPRTTCLIAAVMVRCTGSGSSAFRRSRTRHTQRLSCVGGRCVWRVPGVQRGVGLFFGGRGYEYEALRDSRTSPHRCSWPPRPTNGRWGPYRTVRQRSPTKAVCAGRNAYRRQMHRLR